MNIDRKVFDKKKIILVAQTYATKSERSIISLISLKLMILLTLCTYSNTIGSLLPGHYTICISGQIQFDQLN